MELRKKSLGVWVLLVGLILMQTMELFGADWLEIMKHPRILFLSSYAYDWESVPMQLDGINEAVNGNAKVDYLFMNTKREAYEDVKGEIYNKIEAYQKKDGPYDVVILGDDAALDFGLEYQKDLFDKIPLVFEGINDERKAEGAAKDPMITGIVETFPIEDTIELAYQMYPQAREIVAVTDGTESAQGSMEQYLDARKQYPDLKFMMLDCSKLTDEEIAVELESYDETTILLYLMFTRDGAGNLYSVSEASEFITKYAQIPVFKADELGIGKGLLGGTVVSYEQMGQDAAKMAMEIIRGKRPSEIQMQKAGEYSCFDKEILDQFHIEIAAVPPDAILINTEPTFFEKYKRQIIVAGSLFGIVCMGFTVALVDNQRRRKLLLQLQNKDRMLNGIMSTIPGGIINYQVQGSKIEYLFYSDGLAVLTGRNREEIDQFIRENRLIREIVYPEDYQPFLKKMNEEAGKKSGVNISFRMNSRDHAYCLVHMNAVYIGDQNKGQIFSAVITPVTNQEQNSLLVLDAAVEHSDIIYWECSLDTDTIYLGNKAQEELKLGTTLENIPQGWLDTGIMLEQYNEAYCQMYEDLKRGIPETELEIEIREPSTGKIRWKKMKHTVIRDERGHVVRVVGTSVDISQLKKMEKRYSDQVAYCNSLSENAVSLMRFNLTENRIFYVQEDTEIVDRDLLGQTYDAWLERAGSSTTKSGQEQFLAELQREKLLERFDNGEEELELEHPVMIRNQKRWLSCQIRLMRNPMDGKVEGYMAENDVTERKSFELLVSQIVKVAYEYILEVDLNTNYYRLISGNPLYDDMPPVKGDFGHFVTQFPQNIQSMLQRNYILGRLDKESVFDITGDVTMADDSVHSFKIQVFYVDRDAGKICISRADVTENVQRERKINELLAEALDRAETASKAKGEFLSSMSHEIRTPMNAIIGLTKLAEDEIGDRKAVEQYLKQIDESSNYLLGIINDILDMSRIESGRFELYPEWHYPQEVMQACINMVAPQMKAKKIEFHYPSMERVGNTTQYYVDPLRIQQVVMNILNNAMKFTDEGGCVEMKLENIELNERTATDRLIIRDTGCGMSQEFMTRIFQPFEQEQNKYSGKIQGTGLGLALVKQIVTAMGGSIRVESELGVGSTFYITFPYQYRKCQEAAPKELIKEKQTLLKGKRVLVVEDNEVNMMLSVKLLEKKEMIIEMAENGQIAVDKFEQSPEGWFDVILMDNRMPVMSGNEASRRIRQLERNDARTVPIIAMTADAFHQDEEMSYQSGMNDHLSKPISTEKLYQTLEKWISRKEEQQS